MLKNRFKIFLRVTAFLTVIVYLPTNISYAAPSSYAPSEISIQKALEFSQSLALALPSKLGRMESLHLGSKGTILHVQTAHGHYEAQLKIEKLLKSLNRKFGDYPILLEGADGKLNTELFNFVPSRPELNQKLLRFLAKKSIARGPDLYLAATPGAKGYGVENAQAYKNNRAQFVRVLKSLNDSKNFLEAFEREMEKASATSFSTELRSFLKRLEQYELGIAPLDTWIFELKKLAQKNLKVDLGDPAWQVRWPMMVRFFKIQAMAKQLDLPLYETEKQKFLKEISPSLKNARVKGAGQDIYSQIEMLLNSSGKSVQLPEPGTENIFAKMLRRMPRDFDFKTYPQVTRFIGLLILQSELRSDLFAAEMERLQDLIAEKLTRKEKEKSLLAVFANARLLKKLLALQLTPDDFEKVQNRPTPKSGIKPSEILKQLSFLRRQESKIPDQVRNDILDSLDQVYEDAVNFYRGAKIRDDAMISGVEKNLREHPAKLAVLVTGGFHTRVMREHFENLGYTYAVVTPAISGPDAEGYQSYLKAMFQTAGSVLERSEATAPNGSVNSADSKQLIELADMASTLGTSTRSLAAATVVRWVRHAGEALTRVAVSTPSSPTTTTDTESPSAEPKILGTNNALPGIVAEAAARSELRKQTHDALRFLQRQQPGKNPQRAFQATIDQFSLNQSKAVELAVKAGFPLPPKLTFRSEMHVGVIGNGLLGEGVSRQLLNAMGHATEVIDPNADSASFTNSLEQNEVIYLASTPDEAAVFDYDKHHDKLNGLAMTIGSALRKLRDRGDHNRKVIVLRGLWAPETTKFVYDVIKWNAKPVKVNGAPEDMNFDVVFQPDFSLPEERGQYEEGKATFGLLDQSEVLDAGRDATRGILTRLYTGKPVEFIDVRSAELSKEMLLIYLGAKLAHFDDIAELSRRYGADLSAAAYGAGLDKRIRTLFTNPSLGFGGKLYIYLRWIRAIHLSEAGQNWRSNRVGGNSAEAGRVAKLNRIEEILEHSVTALEKGEDLNKIIQELPRELHMIFLIDTILRVNKQNILDFYDLLNREYSKVNGSLKGKKVTLLSVGASSKSEQVLESPALLLIDKLVKEGGVHEFYVADTRLRQSLKIWIEQKRKSDRAYGAVHFRGVDDDDDYSLAGGRFYEAIENGDLTLIATDSNPDLKTMELKKLSKALKGRPLFDGMNLFGLRADGTHQYQLEAVREADINLVGVGRRNLGPLYEDKSADRVGAPQYRLEDSISLRTEAEYRAAIESRGAFSKGPKNVAVVGVGYVGSTTAALLSELGHDVDAVDVKERQAAIAGLNAKEIKMPIFERDLPEMLTRNRDAGRLKFSTNGDEAIARSGIVYLAVGTPSADNGAADLSYILAATEQIGRVIQSQKAQAPLTKPKIIVVKSTVPPDTFEQMDEALEKMELVLGVDYALVSNPEFLREGQAVKDVTEPDRTVLGFYAKLKLTQRRIIEKEMLELWHPLMQKHPHQVLLTDTASSTLIKYIANSQLAISITLSNIFAAEADRVGADFPEIRKSLFDDERIGKDSFLWPSDGFGGSCFPKDLRAANYSSTSSTGHILPMVAFADGYNESVKSGAAKKAVTLVSDFPEAQEPLKGNTVILLGMAFKGNTDDMRESASVSILYDLLKYGAAKVKIHDPIFTVPKAPDSETVIGHYLDYLFKAFLVDASFNAEYKKFIAKASPNDETLSQAQSLLLTNPALNELKLKALFFKEIYFKKNFLDNGRVVFESQIENLGKADLVVLATDWAQYKSIDLAAFKDGVKPLAVYDGRNLFYPRIQEILAQGIRYMGVGTAGAVRNAAARSEARSAVRRSETRQWIDFTEAARGINFKVSELQNGRSAARRALAIKAITTILSAVFVAGLSSVISVALIKAIFILIALGAEFVGVALMMTAVWGFIADDTLWLPTTQNQLTRAAALLDEIAGANLQKANTQTKRIAKAERLFTKASQRGGEFTRGVAKQGLDAIQVFREVLSRSESRRGLSQALRGTDTHGSLRSEMRKEPLKVDAAFMKKLSAHYDQAVPQETLGQIVLPLSKVSDITSPDFAGFVLFQNGDLYYYFYRGQHLKFGQGARVHFSEETSYTDPAVQGLLGIAYDHETNLTFVVDDGMMKRMEQHLTEHFKPIAGALMNNRIRLVSRTDAELNAGHFEFISNGEAVVPAVNAPVWDGPRKVTSLSNALIFNGKTYSVADFPYLEKELRRNNRLLADVKIEWKHRPATMSEGIAKAFIEGHGIKNRAFTNLNDPVETRDLAQVLTELISGRSESRADMIKDFSSPLAAEQGKQQNLRYTRWLFSLGGALGFGLLALWIVKTEVDLRTVDFSFLGFVLPQILFSLPNLKIFEKLNQIFINGGDAAELDELMTQLKRMRFDLPGDSSRYLLAQKAFATYEAYSISRSESRTRGQTFPPRLQRGRIRPLAETPEVAGTDPYGRSLARVQRSENREFKSQIISYGNAPDQKIWVHVYVTPDRGLHHASIGVEIFDLATAKGRSLYFKVDGGEIDWNRLTSDGSTRNPSPSFKTKDEIMRLVVEMAQQGEATIAKNEAAWNSLREGMVDDLERWRTESKIFSLDLKLKQGFDELILKLNKNITWITFGRPFEAVKTAAQINVSAGENEFVIDLGLPDKNQVVLAVDEVHGGDRRTSVFRQEENVSKLGELVQAMFASERTITNWIGYTYSKKLLPLLTKPPARAELRRGLSSSAASKTEPEGFFRSEGRNFKVILRTGRMVRLTAGKEIFTIHLGAVSENGHQIQLDVNGAGVKKTKWLTKGSTQEFSRGKFKFQIKVGGIDHISLTDKKSVLVPVTIKTNQIINSEITNVFGTRSEMRTLEFDLDGKSVHVIREEAVKGGGAHPHDLDYFKTAGIFENAFKNQGGRVFVIDLFADKLVTRDEAVQAKQTELIEALQQWVALPSSLEFLRIKIGSLKDVRRLIFWVNGNGELSAIREDGTKRFQPAGKIGFVFDADFPQGAAFGKSPESVTNKGTREWVFEADGENVSKYQTNSVRVEIANGKIKFQIPTSLSESREQVVADFVRSAKRIRSEPIDTILLVDDNPDPGKRFENYLSTEFSNIKVQLVLAEDGQAGLEQYRQLVVAGKNILVITDQDMPKLTGSQLIEKIRAEDAVAPIVHLSTDFYGLTHSAESNSLVANRMELNPREIFEQIISPLSTRSENRAAELPTARLQMPEAVETALIRGPLEQIVPSAWRQKFGGNFAALAVAIQNATGLPVVYAGEVFVGKPAVLASRYSKSHWSAASLVTKSKNQPLLLDAAFLEKFLSDEKGAMALLQFISSGDTFVVFDATQNLKSRIIAKLTNRDAGLGRTMDHATLMQLLNQTLKIHKVSAEKLIAAQNKYLIQNSEWGVAALFAAPAELEKINGPMVLALKEALAAGDVQVLIALSRILRQAAHLEVSESETAAQNYLTQNLGQLKRRGNGWLINSIEALIGSLIANHELIATSA